MGCFFYVLFSVQRLIDNCVLITCQAGTEKTHERSESVKTVENL